MDSRLRALLTLLGDDRPSVREGAARGLAASGADPATLRAAVERIEDARLRARARARLEDLRVAALEGELAALVLGPEPSLEAGAFLLARFHYPELDSRSYVAALDGMAAEIRSRLGGGGPREAARALRRFLHDERGFRGNVGAFGDPENVFLNRVLDRRVGIPTSLAVVYLLLGRRLGVPLEGVNFPRHFLLRWTDSGGETFLDPFAEGRFLSRADCRAFLRRAALDARPEFLGRASDREVLTRLARCLVASFRASGAGRAARRFERCLAIAGGAGGAP